MWKTDQFNQKIFPLRRFRAYCNFSLQFDPSELLLIIEFLLVLKKKLFYAIYCAMKSIHLKTIYEPIWNEIVVESFQQLPPFAKGGLFLERI